MPFKSRADLLVRTSDGRNVILQEPLEFVRGSDMVIFRAPAGSASDGISTPSEIWLHFPPFGTWWRAGIIHDAAYRDTLEVFQDGQWVKAHLSKDDSDQLFLEAMASLGVGEMDRNTIYQGVHLAGARAFHDDRV